MKQEKIPVQGETLINQFRKLWLEKGFELIDITQLCKFKLGFSGWANDINSPDEQIYHLRVYYRDEQIGTFLPSKKQYLFEEGYVCFVEDEDFIIFKECSLKKKKNIR